MLLGAAVLGAGALLSACGSGSPQTAGEPKGTYEMKVLHASFPQSQAVARPATMELAVQNTGTTAVPRITVSIKSFNYKSTYPHLADPKRPIWAIERGPGAKAEPPVETEEVSVAGSAQTNYVSTWSLGSLPAGQTRTFIWKVVPVKPGAQNISYRFGAGLAGNAKAVASSGSLEGSFAVFIAPAPPKTHVNPTTGQIEPGPYVPST